MTLIKSTRPAGPRPGRLVRPVALAILTLAVAAPVLAESIPFSGTRSNVSPGGTPAGRCAPALTIQFAPDSFAASGSSNLGSFSYTASHCIAGFPPGPYTDGEFTWDFGDGTLAGTYTGLLSAGAAPGSFDVSETIVFTAGTGRFFGMTGSATATGQLTFGQFQGVPASFGEVAFSGLLTPIPEPATAALWLTGLGMLVAARRRWSGG